MSREHFDTLAVAINTGTNLPSVATPNGQAAFLFLLTSSIAPAGAPVVRPHGLDGATLHPW
ncbi:sodium:proton antiporter [Pseudomonas aeruginosa]|nr:sodium:proton antiporter [Pseudomonas aeruginosa]